jgi:hypothetical protein
VTAPDAHLLNRRIRVQSVHSGALYEGVLVGFRQQGSLFCLSRLAIINRFGGFICSKYRYTRWFHTHQFTVLKVTHEQN